MSEVKEKSILSLPGDGE